MNDQKKELIRKIEEGALSEQEIQRETSALEERHPNDMDLIPLRMVHRLCQGRIQETISLGRLGVSINPYIPEIHYYLAKAYSRDMKDGYLAFKHFEIALFLKRFQTEALEGKDLAKEIASVVKGMERRGRAIEDEGQREKWLFEMKLMQECLLNRFGYFEKRFRSAEPLVGKYYRLNEWDARYVGIYDENSIMRGMGNAHNLVEMKGEFVKVTEVREGERTEFPKGADCLVPIAAEQEFTNHRFFVDGEEIDVCQRYKGSFQYFRVPGGASIMSSGKCYYGDAIPLKMDPKKKKLVLNIFVDGLAWAFLKGGCFEERMPNTSRFFSKGLIFDRSYANGEWTYPSIATFVSGLHTTEHMLFHSDIDGSLPQDQTLLAEYFKQAGYYTSALQYNWRILPSYGHARGYDSFIYKNDGFAVESVVNEAIGQIEAMKETNQFLWISIGELHDVADMEELPRASQARLGLKELCMDILDSTSVKQGSSFAKRSQYFSVLRHIDLFLGGLFDYLEKNYADEEMLVSLFSDHGQGYLLPEGAEFLGQERSNIAFLFRGIKEGAGRVSEIASNVDYTAILCHEAGIAHQAGGDARLPKCMGGPGRKWAVTESLHPGDPYRCVLHGDQEEAYFCNPSPVQDDGRFVLKSPSLKVTDYDGNVIEDSELRQECMDRILSRIAHLLLY